MNVKDLKNKLQRALETLEDYDEDQKIRVVDNTYYLHGTSMFLGTPAGYIDLCDPVESEDEDWGY